MIKVLTSLIFFFLILLSSFLSVLAQGASDGSDAKQKGSGGGGFSVSPTNGAVNFTYPISTHSVGGSPINVSLNYCGSVTYTAFGEHDISVPYAWGNPDGTAWKSITKLHPLWLINVNGFAIQALNTITSFGIQDPTDLTDCYDPKTEDNLGWMIDGYDYCNSLNKLQNPEEQDVIHILRGDGSILELRNAARKTDTSIPYSSCVSGYYYENAINAQGFGIVTFDSTYWPSYLRSSSEPPRILKYYPGDGLEYVFREIVDPYGIRCQGSNNGGPTIFYLEEIRNGYQLVSSFKRSRHYPTESNIDVTFGRALMTEFHGHRITYDDAYASIEALGRTFIVRYGGDWLSIGDGLHPYTALNSLGDSAGILQNYGDITGNNGYGTSCDGGIFGYGVTGFVHSITDPEGRVVQFGYDTISKNYNMRVCNGCCDIEFKPVFRRMTEIKSAGGRTTIEYYPGDYNVTRDKILDAKTKVVPETQHVAKEVKLYDFTDNLLLTSSYSFDNAPSGYDRKSMIISTDNILNLVDTTSIYSRYWSFIAYNPNPYQPYACPNIPFSANTKTVRTSSKGITTSYVFYPDNLTDSAYIMVPTQTATYIKPYGVLDSILVSKTIHSYTLTTANTFGGDTATARRFGKSIATYTAKTVRPDSLADTIFTAVSGYKNIPYSTTLVTRTDTTWDEWKSMRVTDSLRWSGFDTTAVIYSTNSISNKLTALPPLRGLVTSSFLFYKGDTVNGVRRYYDTTYSPTSPPNRRRGYLIADTQYVNNGHIIPSSTTTFRSGWYRTLRDQSINFFGSTSKLLYRNSTLPTGTIYDSDFPSSSPVSKKLSEYREEFELPMGAETYIRKYTPGGTLTTDTLRAYVEHTVGGLASAMIDPNSAYSAIEYDNVGRVTASWSPMNFPPAWKLAPKTVKIWDMQTKIFTRVDSIICSTSELKVGDDTTITTDQTHLRVFNHPSMLYCPTTASPNPVRISQSGHTILKYVPRLTDRFMDMSSLSKTTLRLFIGSVSSDYPPTVHINITFKGDTLSDDYYFNGLDEYDFEDMATQLYPFNIELPSGMTTNLLGGYFSDTLTIEITPVSGGDAELLCKAEYAPHFVLEGTLFDDPHEDFAVSMTYTDSTQITSVLGKIDDASANFQSSWSASTSSKKGRYTALTMRPSPTDATKRLAITTIGNPYSPIRKDTASSYLSGLGMLISAKNAVGYESRFTYTKDATTDTVYHPDGSFIRQTTAVGLPASFGLTGQNFHGFCSVITTYDEQGSKFTSYSDLYGRVRRKVSDTAGLKITERFEYDDFGRLTSYINPKGDSITYAYDDFGHIRSVAHPDFGKVTYSYDILGQLRFSQTQVQHNAKKLTYYQYDDLGRLTISGEAQISGPLISNRLTDLLDANKLHLSVSPSGSIYTANKSLFTNPDAGTVKEFSNSSSIAECLPGNHTHVFDDEEPDSINAPYLRRSLGYWEPVTHTSDTSSFENTGTYPDFVRRGIWYDTLPPRDGAVWKSFPEYKDWDSIAPKKSIRFLKGRPVALAYRGHGGEPWHYLVFSYNEQGFVEATLRYTENLGFDAVYYSYNHTGMLIRQCTADPFNQHCTWYGYDQNGRPDSVWSDLGEDKGLTLAPVLPTFLTRPSTPDAVVFYGKRGPDSVLLFPPTGGNVRAQFFVGPRFGDSVIAKQGLSTIYKEALAHDVTGKITKQTWQSGQLFYGYDSVGRMTSWGIPSTDTTHYVMDSLGNRIRTIKSDTVFQQLDYATGNNRLNSSLATGDSTYYTYDADGAVTRITGSIGGSTIDESFVYGWDTRLYKYKKTLAWRQKPCYPDTVTPITYDATHQDWRYRYSGGGEREQKRLYYSQESDTCSGIMPWVYYLLNANGEQLAVWHGRQTAEPDTCGESGRRVVWYPVEYRSSGGAAVYVRGASGGFVKELRMFDHLGSVRIRMKTTGNETVDYNPYGENRTGTTTARTTFLDKEKDSETKNRYSDFSARKYEEKTGRFLRPDPLWMRRPYNSSYAYGGVSPMMHADPSGLDYTDYEPDGWTEGINDAYLELADPMNPGKKKDRGAETRAAINAIHSSMWADGMGRGGSQIGPTTIERGRGSGGGTIGGTREERNGPASSSLNTPPTDPNSISNDPTASVGESYVPTWVDNVLSHVVFANPASPLIECFKAGIVQLGENYFKCFLETNVSVFVEFAPGTVIADIYNSIKNPKEKADVLDGLTIPSKGTDLSLFTMYLSIDFLSGNDDTKISDANNSWVIPNGTSIFGSQMTTVMAAMICRVIGHEFAHIFDRLFHPEHWVKGNGRDHEADAEEYMIPIYEFYNVLVKPGEGLR